MTRRVPLNVRNPRMTGKLLNETASDCEVIPCSILLRSLQRLVAG
jgi:hypothetical protein